jgi:hypothetical protein
MPGRPILALAVYAALFAPAAALAESAPATKSDARIAWGGIGYYNISGSFNSVGAFGINVGGAINVVPLTPDLPLAIWGNFAIAFPSGFNAYPLTAGAAIRYDKIPVHLLGGLGFTIMPQSNGGPTVAGLGIQAMGFIPLTADLSAQAGIAYHFLNKSEDLFTLTGGIGWSF